MKERSGLFTRVLRPFTRRDGALRPFRLFFADLTILSRRYLSDWTVFNQVVLASGIFIFFTNLLPGITFASDLYDLTGSNWGTIEIVLSMGICNAVFTLFGLQPLTILGKAAPTPLLSNEMLTLSILQALPEASPSSRSTSTRCPSTPFRSTSFPSWHGR